MLYRKELYKFKKNEIKELMKKTGTNTPEEALRTWAYYSYDLRHRCDIHITKVNKTSIEITEYFEL